MVHANGTVTIDPVTGVAPIHLIRISTEQTLLIMWCVMMAIRFHPQCDTATVTIIVDPVNDPPVAVMMM